MAPNPIDFDKVFSADLSKNFVVLLVVCLLFGLYLLLVVIARRFDKKDLDKVRDLRSIQSSPGGGVTPRKFFNPGPTKDEENKN